jgi:transcriptional regulator GlxA family with amidase domain
MSPMSRTVGILLFDDVEVLDFAGPFEVFSVAGRRDGLELFRVVTVAESDRPISTRGGLSVNPAHTLNDCPGLDLLVVPGGFGTRREMRNEAVVAWVVARAAEAESVLSVCTGALILARGGLLDGMDVTTHHQAIELLREAAPGARVHPDRRILDNGPLVVAAGISAGIDASLHLVARMHGEAVARETARYMEYDWRRTGDLAPEDQEGS